MSAISGRNVPVTLEAKSFCEYMEDIRECQWYWGSISAREAVRLLRDRKAGTFLVRDSQSEHSIFSISYRTVNGVYHSRLARIGGMFCLGSVNSLIRSTSLRTFIEMAMHSADISPDSTTQAIQATTANAPAQEPSRVQIANHDLRILMHPSSTDPSASSIELKFPLRRSEFLPSLKYLCRLAIRRAMNNDAKEHISSLPVPYKLKCYLQSANYLSVFDDGNEVQPHEQHRIGESNKIIL